MTVGAQALSPELEAVRKYILEKDYPEVFEDQRYRTRIQDALIVDVDGDGRREVVVHFHPHYRQSPTIVFYRLSKDLEVTRTIEGLAPGGLQALSGDYLDSHTLGVGVDLSVKGSLDTPESRSKFAKSALQQFGGVVAYADFWHVDGRAGGKSYIDMSAAPNPSKTQNCEAFEFPKVRQIAFGPASDDGKNYLAAWVGQDVYLYTIRFTDDGLLEKTVEVQSAPVEFNGFLPGKGLAYSAKGGTRLLTRKRAR